MGCNALGLGRGCSVVDVEATLICWLVAVELLAGALSSPSNIFDAKIMSLQGSLMTICEDDISATTRPRKTISHAIESL